MASALFNKKQQILSKYSKQNIILPNEESKHIEWDNSFEKDANEIYIDEDFSENDKINMKLIGNKYLCFFYFYFK